MHVLQISNVVNQLFPTLGSQKLSTFSCGHIIPKSNLQALVVGKGPRGSDLQFRYEQRSDQALVSVSAVSTLDQSNSIFLPLIR